MQLKLAEYNAEGKFERFIEGEYFYISGDNFKIVIDDIKLRDNKKHLNPKIIVKDRKGNKLSDINVFSNEFRYFFKDETDPLNRFDGLFNGRTYGEGRFVLIRGLSYDNEIYFEDSLFFHRSTNEKSFLKLKAGEFSFEPLKNIPHDSALLKCCGIDEILDYGVDELLNLHENPELWEKVR